MRRSLRLTTRLALALAHSFPSCSVSWPGRRSAPWLTSRPECGVSCFPSLSCTAYSPGRAGARRGRSLHRSAAKSRHREDRLGTARIAWRTLGSLQFGEHLVKSQAAPAVGREHVSLLGTVVTGV